ncbi:unnamed protein product, partial [Darwinula stevensoni]
MEDSEYLNPWSTETQAPSPCSLPDLDDMGVSDAWAEADALPVDGVNGEGEGEGEGSPIPLPLVPNWDDPQEALNRAHFAVPDPIDSDISSQLRARLEDHDCQEFLALLLDSLHETLNLTRRVIPDDLPIKGKGERDGNPEPDTTNAELGISSAGQGGGALSECSRSSPSQSSSPRSCDSYSSYDVNSSFRLHPIPEHIRRRNSEEEDLRLPDCPTEPEGPDCTHGDVDPGDAFAASSSSSSSSLREEEPGLPLTQPIALTDILKDAKTSNINVLITDEPPNNAMMFGSEKFGKSERVRPRHTIENINLAQFHDFGVEKVEPGKDLKVAASLMAEAAQWKLRGSSFDDEEEVETGSVKRLKLEVNMKEKNLMCAPTSSSETTSEIPMDCDVRVLPPLPTFSQQDIQSADLEWDKYLAANRSIVVSTFQGQFKSTVTCNHCQHVSVTFEPFMYLSVPLPHAMERQICVTYVSGPMSQPPVRYLLTLNKHDKVRKLKQSLASVAGLVDTDSDLVIAEVLDHHVARTIDDATSLRFVNDVNRDVYAFRLLPAPPSMDAAPINKETLVNKVPRPASSSKNSTTAQGTEDEMLVSSSQLSCEEPRKSLQQSSETEVGDSGVSSSTEVEVEVEVSPDAVLDTGYEGDNEGEGGNEAVAAGPSSSSSPLKPCAICLEDMPDSELLVHTPCNCFLCQNCIDMSCKHYGGGLLQCPVCNEVVNPCEYFQPLDKVTDLTPRLRILQVGIVLREDSLGDGDNNKRRSQLFGHPYLLQLPSMLQAAILRETIDALVGGIAPYDLLLVDGQGYRCSRCMFTAHCQGCAIPHEGEFHLQTGDNLAVRFSDIPPEMKEWCNGRVNHESMQSRCPTTSLTLDDCLNAFSESEELDESNGWWCPTCQLQQCATKTLTIWRLPRHLILYLKRFIFHESASIKLDNPVMFPVEEALDMSLFLTGPSASHPLYDLYACVCHFGGVSSCL